jgi:hypothetical protein
MLTRGRLRLLSLLLNGVAAGAALSPAITLGQQLNLTPRYAPKPGDGVGASRSATSLEARARSLREDPGADPNIEPRRAILHDLTMLAHDLLVRGESLGPDGSLLVLSGHALAADLDGMDAWLAAGSFDSTTLVTIATELRAVGTQDATTLPADAPALFRELRDRLAPLVDDRAGTTACGWWIRSEAVPPPGPTPSFDALTADLRLPAAIRSQAAELDALIAEARNHASFRASGASLVRALAEAAPVLKSPPAWLASPAETLGGELARSVEELMSGDRAETGLHRLRRLVLVTRVVDQTRSLPSPAAPRAFTDALARAASSLTATITPAELARWRALAGALEGLEAPPVNRESLERNLRPALPILTAAAGESRTTLIAALPRLLEADAVTTEPALVNAQLAHRRRLDDVRMLTRLSAALSEDPPKPEPGSRATPPIATLRARVLKLSQDLTKPKLRDVALAELRVLASGLAPSSSSTTVRTLFDDGAADSITHEVAGSDRQLIIEMVTRAREQWVTESAKQLLARREVSPFREELGGAIETYIRARAALDERSLAMLNRWPAFRLTPDQAQRLTLPLREAAERARVALRGGDPDAFERAAAELAVQEQCLWIGMLALSVPEEACRSRQDAPSMPASLARLALGGPDLADGWRVDQAELVALICRYAAEIDTAPPERAAQLTGYLGTQARTLGASLRASEP